MMVKTLVTFTMFFIFTAPSVGYQIQNPVNQVDGTVDIDTKGMIRTCRQQNDTFNPLIDITDSFIFNFWDAGCYVKADYPEYAQLFNDVLSTMRRCLHPCNRDLRYRLPDINCTGQAYPNTISINYHCGTSWQLPEIVATTSTVPAMTTARSAQTTTATPNSVVSSTVPGSHQLVAEERAGSEGYLSVDLNTVVCDEIDQLHVLRLESEIDEDHPCPSTLSPTAVENQLHENNALLSQPHCMTNDSEHVHKVTITYDCLSMPETGDPDESATDPEPSNIGLILGIAVPIVVLLVVLVFVAVGIIYKRRNSIKVFLGNRSNAYDPDEGIYQDPNHAFNYSQMDSAYSNENIGDNALYQDPALILRPPPMSALKKHKPSVKSMESDYQDPNSLACTGPPGTPSPIRDALYSTHDDPSSSSEVFGDVDGKISDDQNVYDMPCVVVNKTSRTHSEESPEGYPLERRLSQSSYTHMVVTDGQMEPHNYAIIRKSRPYTDSVYYDLQNEVQLYDSPVYDSTEDVREDKDSDGGNK
ncbi:uncharacterized protein [Watersipora subatra]|uniref:uncharacterized protein isoform X2 n=1 Tax=Watersipora subatra TaxID=2589382 RepID=UPI00355C20D5